MSPGRSPSGAWIRPTHSPSRSISRTGSSLGSGWRTTSGPACASGTRSPGPARTCSAPGTLDRPWLDGTGDEMDAARNADGGGVRVLHQARHAVLLLPRPRRRAGRATASATSASNLDALVDDAAGYQERTGVRLLWGTANLFTHPRYQAGAATNPDPEVFAYAAAQVEAHARGDAATGRRELRAVGRPRGLRHAAQHRPAARGRPARAASCTWSPSTSTEIGFSGQLLIEPKPMEPTKHQYDYDVADRATASCVTQRPRGRVQGQHRGQPRDARRPQLPPRGRVRRRQRHARQHRRQPRRPAERLGHRPVPELGRGSRRCRCTRSCARAASRPAASTSTPSCAARASIGPTCSTPTSAGSTRLPSALLVAADLVERGDLAELTETSATRAGTRTLGTAIMDGSVTLAELEAARRDRQIDPRPCRAARSGWRTSSTSASGRQTADPRPAAR